MSTATDPDEPSGTLRPGSVRGREQTLIVAFGYAVFASLWIILSDTAVDVLFTSPAQVFVASIVKGWVFVAITTLLLYGLTRRMHARIVAALDREHQTQMDTLRTLLLLKAIADSSDDAIFAKDTQGRYTLFNRAAGEIVGQDPHTVLGQDDRTLFPTAQAEGLHDSGQRVIAENRIITVEDVLQTPKGERVFLTTKGPLRGQDGNIIGIFGISRNITERKRAEKTLRDSEQFKNAILNAVDANIAVLDASGVILSVNQAWVKFAEENIAPAELSNAEVHVGTNYLEICRRGAGPYASQARQALHGIEDVIAHRIPKFAMEYPCHSPHLRRWFVMSVTSLDDGTPGVVVAHTSITERKLIEQNLQDITARQQTLLRTLPDLVWLIDQHGVYLACNPRFESLVNALEASVVGKTDFDFFDAETAAAFRAKDKDALSSNQAVSVEEHVTFASDGHSEILQTIKTPLYDSDQGLIGVLGISRDITAMKKAESAMRLQADEIARRNHELVRFNKMMVGRELDMIALKKEVNALSLQVGRPAPYPLDFIEPDSKHDAS